MSWVNGKQSRLFSENEDFNFHFLKYKSNGDFSKINGLEIIPILIQNMCYLCTNRQTKTMISTNILLYNDKVVHLKNDTSQRAHLKTKRTMKWNIQLVSNIWNLWTLHRKRRRKRRVRWSHWRRWRRWWWRRWRRWWRWWRWRWRWRRWWRWWRWRRWQRWRCKTTKISLKKTSHNQFENQTLNIDKLTKYKQSQYYNNIDFLFHHDNQGKQWWIKCNIKTTISPGVLAGNVVSLINYHEENRDYNIDHKAKELERPITHGHWFFYILPQE